MFSRDSHRRGPGAAGVPALILAVLGLAGWVAGGTVAGIETGAYDFLQRAMAGSSTAPVTLVTVDVAGPGSIWAAPDFPRLVTAAARAGAAVVVPTESPGRPLRPGEVERVARLIAMETDASAGDDVRLGRLRAEFAQLESRERQQQRNASAITAARNVIVGPRLVAGSGEELLDPACRARLAAASGPAGVDRHMAPLNPLVCSGAAGLGNIELVPDADDGVVRAAPAAVAVPDGTLPAVQTLAAGRLRADPTEDAGAGGERLLRYYTGGAFGQAFPVLRAADIVAGRGTERLEGQVLVIGRTPDLAATVATPLAAATPEPLVIATAVANEVEGAFLTRPAWLLVAEAFLALLVGPALLLAAGTGSDALRRALLAGVGTLVALAAVQVALFAGGLWTHLASLVLYVPLACLAVAGWSVLQRRRAPAVAGLGIHPETGLTAGPVGELDLAFSVLRQQPTTDETKQKLYDIAMEHGRRRDYARAERVFRHLAARDPNYRDVSAKLERLSGARLAAQPKERPTTAAAPRPEQVRTLGRYSLERVLGRGAMATVYLGRDPTIGRRVAIKTVPLAEEFEESDIATAKTHFRREAESSGRLNHPNIITIYDAGEDGNVAYLAMEYFEGQPLSHYTQADQLLPPRVVLELAARAAEALHYAHLQNVVHRDVKPANILYDRASDSLKLTDFGIARLTDANRTRTGIILGTPSYMSPEQLTASKVTGQSDLYSLGVTVYHLLTGSPPFQADSIPRLMQRIATERHRPVRDIRDDVPACVDAILERAMAKDPSDRFPDGRAMALALRACSDSVPA